MPSEMPSKRGVQCAELYTMGKQPGDRAKSPRFLHRVRPFARFPVELPMTFLDRSVQIPRSRVFSLKRSTMYTLKFIFISR